MQRLHYTVHSVPSGEKAVEYLKERPVDLLILDMIMEPGIDGLETYKQIVKIHPHQKVIIASGYSETGRVKEALSLGVRKYVKKPYTLEKIATAVNDQLSE